MQNAMISQLSLQQQDSYNIVIQVIEKVLLRNVLDGPGWHYLQSVSVCMFLPSLKLILFEFIDHLYQFGKGF